MNQHGTGTAKNAGKRGPSARLKGAREELATNYRCHIATKSEKKVVAVSLSFIGILISTTSRFGWLSGPSQNRPIYRQSSRQLSGRIGVAT